LLCFHAEGLGNEVQLSRISQPPSWASLHLHFLLPKGFCLSRKGKLPKAGTKGSPTFERVPNVKLWKRQQEFASSKDAGNKKYSPIKPIEALYIHQNLSNQVAVQPSDRMDWAGSYQLTFSRSADHWRTLRQEKPKKNHVHFLSLVVVGTPKNGLPYALLNPF